MDKNIFLSADLHFGHLDKKFRDRWKNASEMHQFIIERWNKKVRPNDRVYILGDVARTEGGLALVKLLHGKKVLILGNRDFFPLTHYFDIFKKVVPYSTLFDYLLTHIPVHPSFIYPYHANIHGHSRGDYVIQDERIPDVRYYCVSLNQTNWEPVHLDEIHAATPKHPPEKLNLKIDLNIISNNSMKNKNLDGKNEEEDEKFNSMDNQNSEF